jgi:hypothetical protein
MTPEQLAALSGEVATRHAVIAASLSATAVAAADQPSDDRDADALLEGYFLQLFTASERDLERLFLHFVTGGASTSGAVAQTYLRLQQEDLARRLVRGAWRFLSWGKPDAIRETASTYIENGWPIVDMMAARTQELADCERVRNRIAHRSIEADLQYMAVQRNLFQTERVFEMSPGQLLRTRHRRTRDLTILFYAAAMRDTLQAIIDPPS